MKLSQGLHCKACDKGLETAEIDPELCGECMAVVTDYNKDLDPPDKFEMYVPEDAEESDAMEHIVYMTLEEFENAILTGEIPS